MYDFLVHDRSKKQIKKILKLPDNSGRNRSLEIMDELFQSNFWGKAESNSNLIPEKHKCSKVLVKAL